MNGEQSLPIRALAEHFVKGIRSTDTTSMSMYRRPDSMNVDASTQTILYHTDHIVRRRPKDTAARMLACELACVIESPLPLD
jgi:hypothetical protein